MSVSNRKQMEDRVPGDRAWEGELRRLRIVPVIVITDADGAAPLARALVEGGLPCAEITFRTSAAPEALRKMRQEHPDMLLGAGTILTTQQAVVAQAAGADFLVSPGYNPRVVEYCREQNLALIPGVCTPTEIESALEAGFDLLKFFPAEPMGGVPFLAAVASPYPTVKFMPTGGIGPSNIGNYLALDNVLACGGSWMARTAWIEARDFGRIREEVGRAVRSAAGAVGVADS